MWSHQEALKKKIDALPRKPGVYLFKGAGGEILYIGKAINLRARVQTYLNESGDDRPLIPYLRSDARDVDTIVTPDEFEALLLENSMIKKEKPRYNIRLRDDKSYVSVRHDPRQPFSRLEVVRRVKRDGARYLGPFLSAGSVRDTLRLILPLHPLRLCTDRVFRNRTRPCVYAQIGRCPAPCVGRISREDYQENLKAAIRLLKGQETDLVHALEKKMWAASEARDFEGAARLRDRIQAVKRTTENARVISSGQLDRDAIALVRAGDDLVVEVITVREGRLLSARPHAFTSPLQYDEVITSFLVQYYSRDHGFPLQVLVEKPLTAMDSLAAWLGEKRGGAVRIKVPRKGAGKKLLVMARENAHLALERHLNRSGEVEALLHGLRTRLGLARDPVRMECYDISHTGGEETVGVVVTFVNGEPHRDGYRKYKVRGPGRGDDYEALEEVLSRRLGRLVSRDEALPDLMVIDGGRGQLSRAARVMKEVGIDPGDLDLIALAKGRNEEERQEKIHVFGGGEPVRIARNRKELHLLDRLRDETHRFAITYHKKLRARKRVGSVLDGIPGVGPKTRSRILTAFGSVRGLKEVSPEEIAEKAGISLRVARAVSRFVS